MLRIPIPFVMALIIATVAVTVYLYLTVIPVPAVADPNYTATLVAGSPYMWRGSAGSITFESNATIELTYRPLPYVVHLNGMPGNVSITKDVWIIYFKARGYPILYVRDKGVTDWPLLFKLVNVTKIGDITVYVPRLFDLSETLTYAERDGIISVTGSSSVPLRVLDVSANSTHLIVHAAGDTYTTTYNFYVQLPSPTVGTSMRTAFKGIGFTYMIGDVTYSGYAMPYVYFVITPQANAQVKIYVK